MLPLGSRYAHVPLAAASLLLLFVVIAWLLVHRMEGLDPIWPLGARSPGVVTIPATPPDASLRSRAPAAPDTLGVPSAMPAPGGRPRPAAAPSQQYVLESGPFATPDGADAVEARLARLGHTTVRFRKEDATRLYVVTLAGFASRQEAEEAVRQLGQGTVTTPDGAPPEVTLGRLRSLGEAVNAARPLRARGYEVRVAEALAPTVIYHLRYGRFDNRADAQALRDELARSGITSRVVSVQTSDLKIR